MGNRPQPLSVVQRAGLDAEGFIVTIGCVVNPGATFGAKGAAFDPAVVTAGIPALQAIGALRETDIVTRHDQRHAKSARRLLLTIAAMADV